MPDPDTSPAARLHRGAQRPARLIRLVCQLILGAGLAVALILKVYMVVLTDHVCAADATSLGNLIRCTPTLSLMAYVLALSAGFDLAYKLFDEQVDRIMAPVTLGLGAAALSVLSNMHDGGAGWRDAIVIAALIASLAGIVWLRRFLSGGNDG